MRAVLLLVISSTIAYAETPKPAPPPALAKADPVPAVKGPVTKLAVKSSAMIGGVKVAFTYNSHKHMAAGRGSSVGMWGFEFTRAGVKEEIELRTASETLEAEVSARGVLMVFRRIDYGTFEVVLASAKSPKPLDDDQCEQLIDKAAEKRKFPTGGSASLGEVHGIIQKSTPVWVGYCGTLTRRIWFAPPFDKDQP